MLDLAYFIGGLAGAAILTALTVKLHPESPLWKWLLRIGIVAFVACAGVPGFIFLRPLIFGAAEPFFYFDISNVPSDSTTGATVYPISVVNSNDFPFNDVVAHFFPANAKRDANNPAYYSLGGIQFNSPILYQGTFRIGRAIGISDMGIEFNAVLDNKSIFFVERLQVMNIDGKIVQAIDVWKDDSKKVYSSQRPPGFKESPVPWH